MQRSRARESPERSRQSPKRRVREHSPPARSMDLWILAGQSNMAGRGRVQELRLYRNADHAVQRFDGQGCWVPALDPLHKDIDVKRAGACGVGPGLVFAHKLRKLLDVDDRIAPPIGLVPCAVGGVSMDKWQPEYTEAVKPRGRQRETDRPWEYCEGAHNLFEAMVQRSRDALKKAPEGSRLAGMLWYQGEADAMNWEGPYAARFQSFVEAARLQLDCPELPIFTVAITGWNNQLCRHLSEIRRDQLGDCRDIPHVYVTDAFGLSMKQDGLHLATPGQLVLGERLAKQAFASLRWPKRGGGSDSGSGSDGGPRGNASLADRKPPDALSRHIAASGNFSSDVLDDLQQRAGRVMMMHLVRAAQEVVATAAVTRSLGAAGSTGRGGDSSSSNSSSSSSDGKDSEMQANVRLAAPSLSAGEVRASRGVSTQLLGSGGALDGLVLKLGGISRALSDSGAAEDGEIVEEGEASKGGSMSTRKRKADASDSSPRRRAHRQGPNWGAPDVVRRSQRVGNLGLGDNMGERDFVSLASLLGKLPLGHGTFYHLGCGTGNTVFAAALLCEFSKVVGVERMQYETALDQARSTLGVYRDQTWQRAVTTNMNPAIRQWVQTMAEEPEAVLKRQLASMKKGLSTEEYQAYHQFVPASATPPTAIHFQLGDFLTEEVDWHDGEVVVVRCTDLDTEQVAFLMSKMSRLAAHAHVILIDGALESSSHGWFLVFEAECWTGSAPAPARGYRRTGSRGY